jgi:hypothetical protein
VSTVKSDIYSAGERLFGAVMAFFLFAWLLMLAVGAATPLAWSYWTSLLVILGVRSIGGAWRGYGR